MHLVIIIYAVGLVKSYQSKSKDFSKLVKSNFNVNFTVLLSVKSSLDCQV